MEALIWLPGPRLQRPLQVFTFFFHVAFRSLDLPFVSLVKPFEEPARQPEAPPGGEDAPTIALWLYVKRVFR